MPREKKPPAKPIEIPRTEKDNDTLLTAIEQHQAEGERLGRLFNDGDLDADAVLQQAAERDDRLYAIADIISEEREKEIVKQERMREGRI